MGNSIGEDIQGKYVVIGIHAFKEKDKFARPETRVFRASGGFGCKPYTGGTAVIGYYLFDGEKSRMDGYDLERLATGEEIEKAKKIFEENKANDEIFEYGPDGTYYNPSKIPKSMRREIDDD